MTPHRHRLTACRALVLALVLPAAVSAQAPDSSAMQLERLVVTATRSDRTVGDVSAAVTVLDAADLRQSGASTVGDVLRSIPGISALRQFSSMVGSPASQAVVLRGIGGSASSRTLVLLDGQPIVDPWAGWMYWDRVPMDLVERIEVVRGGTAGTWGNRALGGVVNVITRAPTASGGRVTAQGGGLGTWKGTGYAAWVGDRVRFSGFTEQAGTDGYITIHPDQRGPIHTRERSEHGTYLARATWDASPAVTVDVDGSWYDWKSADGTPSAASGIEIGTLRSQVRVRTDGGTVWTLGAHAGTQTSSTLIATTSDDLTEETPASNLHDIPAKTLGASAHWARAARGRHELAAGADVEWTDGEANEEFLWRNGAFTRERHAGGEQLLAGAYVQDAFATTDALELFVSGRVNLWRTMNGFLEEVDMATDAVLTSSTQASRTTTGADFNVGFRHVLGDRLAWRGTVFSGFRAPTLNELHRPFRSSGNVVGAPNSELEPERLVGFEVGADATLSRQVTARATFFFNRVTDAIGDATIRVTGDQAEVIEPCGRVPANGVCRQRANFGTIRSVGVETELDVRPSAAWSVHVAHTFNPTKVLDTAARPELEGARVRRVPEQQLLVRVHHRNPRLMDVSVSSRYLGSMFDDDLNRSRIDDSFLVDASASRRVTPSAELFMTVENLLGTENEVAVSTGGEVRLGLPRMVQAGVRLTF